MHVVRGQILMTERNILMCIPLLLHYTTIKMLPSQCCHTSLAITIGVPDDTYIVIIIKKTLDSTSFVTCNTSLTYVEIYCFFSHQDLFFQNLDVIQKRLGIKNNLLSKYAVFLSYHFPNFC